MPFGSMGIHSAYPSLEDCAVLRTVASTVRVLHGARGASTPITIPGRTARPSNGCNLGLKAFQISGWERREPF